MLCTFLKFSLVAMLVCFFLPCLWWSPIGEWLCGFFYPPITTLLWSSSSLSPVCSCISCSADSCRALDAASLHCCKSTLRIQVQILYSWILFSKAAFQLSRAQLVLLHGAQPVWGTGLSICLDWTSFDFCQPISPGCYGLLAAAVPCSDSQLLPPIWYHLQTWRAFIPSVQTINNCVRKHWP